MKKIHFAYLLAMMFLLCDCSMRKEKKKELSSELLDGLRRGEGNSSAHTRNATSKPIASWPPSIDLISADLVGHSLAEGVKSGYRRPDWRFEIEYGNVSDLKILNVLTFTEKKYLILAEMKLSNTDNYYYQTKVRINYVKSKLDNTPKLDYVTSLGMTLVSNGEYNNDITSELVDDGWGGVTCLEIKNIGEVALAVGGKVLVDNQWKKFSNVVSPNNSINIGGTFGGGSVADYRIDFVVREN